MTSASGRRNANAMATEFACMMALTCAPGSFARLLDLAREVVDDGADAVAQSRERCEHGESQERGGYRIFGKLKSRLVAKESSYHRLCSSVGEKRRARSRPVPRP